MINKLSEVERKIDDLKAAELALEDKATHQGYRDASRRNRIEKEIEALDEIQRREASGGEFGAPTGLSAAADTGRKLDRKVYCVRKCSA